MKKIIIAEFKHETNSFAPELTDENKFRDRDYLFGDQILKRFTGAKNELGGFIDYFAGKEEYELIPVLAFNAQPGGIVTQAVYDTAQAKLLEAVHQVQGLSGILLALHGAMVVENLQDGEGELLAALRQEAGRDVPIIASLDLHANLTQKMVENADGLFPFDYYPHTDSFEAGLRASKCMDRTLKGDLHPVLRCCKLDLLLPYMPTAEPIMKKYVQKAQALRYKGDIYNVNICHGFFSADIYEQGMAVVAVTNNDPSLAQTVADSLGKEIWEDRANFRRNFYTIDQAIDEAVNSEGKPFVFADVADNPGSGATGDSTHMLRRFLERKVENVAVAAIYDPETVAKAEQAGVGAKLKVDLGGKLCPDITGGPITCEAYVRAITDGVHYTKDFCKGTLTYLGKTAVLVINGIQVLVSSVRTQPWDLEAFRTNGITPEDAKILAVKSAVHYRESYGTIAHKMIDVELPAIAPQNPEMMQYQRTRRPIYPLDAL